MRPLGHLRVGLVLPNLHHRGDGDGDDDDRPLVQPARKRDEILKYQEMKYLSIRRRNTLLVPGDEILKYQEVKY